MNPEENPVLGETPSSKRAKRRDRKPAKNVAAPKPENPVMPENQVAKLTEELLAAKNQIESLQRTCMSLETTIRVQARLIPLT